MTLEGPTLCDKSAMMIDPVRKSTAGSPRTEKSDIRTVVLRV
jgi:hypothetical protein